MLRRRGTNEVFRGAVAIGDAALDLAALHGHGALDSDAADALRLAAQPALNNFMAAGPRAWRALRHALFRALAQDAVPTRSACCAPA